MVGHGIPAAREPDFDLRGAQPGGFEIGIHGPIVLLQRVHLRLEILQRLAHVRLALFDAEFDLLPHLLLRGLHVGRGLDLQLVRGGQKFLRLRSRLFLTREFQRGFLLRLLHGFDAAVQLVHHPFGIPLLAASRLRRRPRSLRHVFKFCDLRLEPFDLLVLRVELPLHLLALLVCATGEIRPEGHRRAAFRDLVHRVLHILAQLPDLLDGSLVRLGQRLALLLQIHDLALVITAHHRDAALHIGGKVGERNVHLQRSRSIRNWRGRERRRGHRSHTGTGRFLQKLRKLRRPVHRLVRAGAREPGTLLHTAATGQDTARLRRLRRTGGGLGRRLPRAQLFHQRRGGPGAAVGCGFVLRACEELLDFLPRETDLHIVCLHHLGAENLRQPAVDLGEIHHRVALRDPLRERGGVEPQLGLQVMRPGQEKLRGDAVQEIAEFQPDILGRRRGLLRHGRGRGLRIARGSSRHRLFLL